MSKSKKCDKCFNGNLIASILVGAQLGGLGYRMIAFLANNLLTQNNDEVLSQTRLKGSENFDVTLEEKEGVDLEAKMKDVTKEAVKLRVYEEQKLTPEDLLPKLAKQIQLFEVDQPAAQK